MLFHIQDVTKLIYKRLYFVYKGQEWQGAKSGENGDENENGWPKFAICSIAKEKQMASL